MKIGASLVELVMPTVIVCAAQTEAYKVATTSPSNIAYLTASSPPMHAGNFGYP
jgi:hypothetical protein